MDCVQRALNTHRYQGLYRELHHLNVLQFLTYWIGSGNIPHNNTVKPVFKTTWEIGTTYTVQWNLGIRDTHGTVKNCPEFWGILISQVHICVLNRPIGTGVAALNSQVVPISQVVLKTDFTVEELRMRTCRNAAYRAHFFLHLSRFNSGQLKLVPTTLEHTQGRKKNLALNQTENPNSTRFLWKTNCFIFNTFHYIIYKLKQADSTRHYIYIKYKVILCARRRKTVQAVVLQRKGRG